MAVVCSRLNQGMLHATLLSDAEEDTQIELPSTCRGKERQTSPPCLSLNGTSKRALPTNSSLHSLSRSRDIFYIFC